MKTSCGTTDGYHLGRQVKTTDDGPVFSMGAAVGDLLCAVVLSPVHAPAGNAGVLLRVSVANHPMPVDAAVAAACLLQPETGDLVLLCRAQSMAADAPGWWVLSVLQRSRSAALATLGVAGADGLLLQAPSLRLAAQDIEIDALRTTLRAGSLQLVASVVQVVAQQLKQVARVFHTAADTVTEHCRTRVAVVDEMDSTRAGIAVVESRGAMVLKGEQVLVDAKQTVRVDGEHILMG